MTKIIIFIYLVNWNGHFERLSPTYEYNDMKQCVSVSDKMNEQIKAQGSGSLYAVCVPTYPTE